MAKAQLPVFITPEGYDKLKAEVDYLWKEERPRVTREVEAAAALGDRSENAEYQYGKRRLREIDRRLRFLSGRLDEVQVLHPAAQAARINGFVRPISLNGMKLALAALRIPPFDSIELNPESTADAEEWPAEGPTDTASTF